MIPFAGKDPTESQIRRFRWPKPEKVQPQPVAAAVDPEEIRRRSLNTLRKRGMPVWAREIVERVSHETCVSIDQMAGDGKKRRIIHARNQAIYQIKEARPDISTPRIGKWFAKDHTSILHSIASHSDRTGAPALVGYNLQRARKRNAAFNAWKRQQAKAKAASGRPS